MRVCVSISVAFYGFLDASILLPLQIFEPLNEAAMKGVLGLKLTALTKSLASKGIDFKVAESAMKYILDRAWSHKYGGRRMGK